MGIYFLILGYAMSHQSLHSSSSTDSPMTQSGAYAIDMSGRQLIGQQVIAVVLFLKVTIKMSGHLCFW